VIGQGLGPEIGAIPATSVVVVSSTQVTATTGAHARPGSFTVFVTSSDGTRFVRRPAQFTYTKLDGWGPVTEIAGAANGLVSVSCADVSDRAAVGGSIAVTESAGVWGAPVTGFDQLNGVSCGGAGDCTAVGIIDGVGDGSITETDGVWGPPTEIPNTTPDGDPIASVVSCPDATDCTTVGTEGSPIGPLGPFYATESDGVWANATVLTGGLGLFGTGVSCPDATDCTALGPDFSLNETAGVWGPETDIPASLLGVRARRKTNLLFWRRLEPPGWRRRNRRTTSTPCFTASTPAAPATRQLQQPCFPTDP
jgi:hypothetical protein